MLPPGGEGQLDDDGEVGGSFARGCGFALLILLVLAVVVVTLLALTACGSGPARDPGPGVTLAPSTRPASTAGPFDEVISAEWEAQGFGCATPSQLVVDAIAPALEELGVPRFEARIEVGSYRDRVRCPGA